MTMSNEYDPSLVETNEGENVPTIRDITVEDIQGIELDFNNTEYTGEGATSFSSKYDEQKRGYLESFGIETKGLDHARLVTSFVIFSHIASLKAVGMAGGDLEKAVDIANNILKESRIDTLGFREDLGSGITYEQIRKAQGYSANSECRVNTREYNMLLENTFRALIVE